VNLGTPNKPLEWTGHHQLFTGPAQIHCLPLRGSVRSTLPISRWPRDAANTNYLRRYLVAHCQLDNLFVKQEDESLVLLCLAPAQSTKVDARPKVDPITTLALALKGLGLLG
jgi:hypothetical protein